MKAKHFVVVIIFLGLLMTSCSTLVKQNDEKVKQSSVAKSDHFFIPVQVDHFSPSQAPCLNAEIEGKNFSMKLDLGMKGDLSMADELLDQISSKAYIRDEIRYGFRGKKYPINIYQVPRIKIGAISFKQVELQNDCAESRKDAVIILPEGGSSSGLSGKLGWELFYNSNLLVDTAKSQIAFCDSLDTLKKHGYPTEDFIKAPLLIERGLVEFEANTPSGPLRCVLDTGSTINILNRELDEGTSIEQAFLDDENIVEYPSFCLQETDLGPINFHRLPIKIPIKIEAILGMEFFENHLVFIDFSDRQIYFRKIAD